MLATLTRATDWVWITGNHDEKGVHDPAAPTIPGTHVEELDLAGMVLRHEARAGETGENSLALPSPPAHRAKRPCDPAPLRRCQRYPLDPPGFRDLDRGPDAADPAILAAMHPARSIDALVPAGTRVARFPVWREAA
jgi:hypothetical protein